MIPKIAGNKFLFENWNREFCTNFYDMYKNKEFIKSHIIGCAILRKFSLEFVIMMNLLLLCLMIILGVIFLNLL